MKPEIKVGQRRRCQKCASARMTCSKCGAKCCSHRMSQWTPGAGNGVCDVCDPPRRKDALPEAKANDAEHVCGVSDCATGELCGVSAATPPAALSQLEVVRDFVKAKSEGLEMRDVSAALATLEESIRADERARVGDELQRRGYPVAGGAVLAMKR